MCFLFQMFIQNRWIVSTYSNGFTEVYLKRLVYVLSCRLLCPWCSDYHLFVRWVLLRRGNWVCHDLFSTEWWKRMEWNRGRNGIWWYCGLGQHWKKLVVIWRRFSLKVWYKENITLRNFVGKGDFSINVCSNWHSQVLTVGSLGRTMYMWTLQVGSVAGSNSEPHRGKSFFFVKEVRTHIGFGYIVSFSVINISPTQKSIWWMFTKALSSKVCKGRFPLWK